MRTFKELVGNRIQLAREGAGLSQDSLAAALTKDLGKDVDQSRISRWESGKNLPTGRNRKALLRALNAQYDQIFGLDDWQKQIKTISEMTPAQLEDLVARASKRDGTVNLENERLKRENAELKAKLKSPVWKAWNDSTEAQQALFLYLSGNPGPMDAVPQKLLEPILKWLRQIKIRRRGKGPASGQKE